MRHIVNFDNSLASLPELVAEFDYEKNAPLTPKNISIGCDTKKLWWVCQNNHSWSSSVYKRRHGKKCPYCYPQFSIAFVNSENSFAEVCPELVSEWHPTKNGDLFPSMVSTCSDIRVWWVCANQHIWKTSVKNRYQGTECPICVRKMLSIKKRRPKNLSPELCKEWHPSKNLPLTPNDVSAYSVRQIWWVCKKGHEWQSTVEMRTKGMECPTCEKIRYRLTEET